MRMHAAPVYRKGAELSVHVIHRLIHAVIPGQGKEVRLHATGNRGGCMYADLLYYFTKPVLSQESFAEPENLRTVTGSLFRAHPCLPPALRAAHADVVFLHHVAVPT